MNEKPVKTDEVSTNDKYRSKCYADGSPVTKFTEILRAIMFAALLIFAIITIILGIRSL